MPGKWGGARAGRAPLDPPMNFYSSHFQGLIFCKFQISYEIGNATSDAFDERAVRIPARMLSEGVMRMLPVTQASVTVETPDNIPFTC